jgi:hypothetical protein
MTMLRRLLNPQQSQGALAVLAKSLKTFRVKAKGKVHPLNLLPVSLWPKNQNALVLRHGPKRL